MTTTPLSEPLEVLQEVVTSLEKANVPYFVGGSFASGAHSQFRATNDLDIVCKFSLPSLQQFLGDMEKSFYVDEIAATNAFNSGRSFNIIHNKSVMKVDIFTKITDFDELQLSRAISLPLENIAISPKFATAEDTILAKIMWYKKGNEQSERQWSDINLVLNFNKNTLDYQYLRTQARTLGITEILERLCRSSEM